MKLRPGVAGEDPPQRRPHLPLGQPGDESGGAEGREAQVADGAVPDEVGGGGPQPLVSLSPEEVAERERPGPRI